MARRIGDPARWPTRSRATSRPTTRPSSPRRRSSSRPSSSACARGGDLERAPEGYEHRLTALLELGDMRGGEGRAGGDGEARGRASPAVAGVVRGRIDALIALLEGNFAEAEALIARRACWGWAPELERGRRPPAPAVPAAPRAGPARRARGPGQQALGGVPDLPDLALRVGADHGRARAPRRGPEALDALAADGFAALPFDEEWTSRWGCWPRPRSAEDRPRAEALYERLRPYADGSRSATRRSARDALPATSAGWRR